MERFSRTRDENPQRRWQTWVHSAVAGRRDARTLAASGSFDLSAINRRTPMGRLGTEQEVAEGIAFLLSPDHASYITGHTLEVNGGWTACGFP